MEISNSNWVQEESGKRNEPREAVVSVDPEGNRLQAPGWLVIKFPVDDEVKLKEILTNTPSSAPNAKMSIALWSNKKDEMEPKERKY